jgi:soluble lytic murein transglycosylase-like protein
MGSAHTFGEIMNYLAEKIIGLVLCTVFGVTALTGAPSASGGQPDTIALAPISVQPYLIEPTTTTSSTIYIDPYTSACEQFSALAINLGWPADQRTVLESIMKRESNCTPNAFNSKDPNGGSRGLMQINGFWTPWLTERGIIAQAEDLLQAQTNLLAALAIYNYGVERHGFGWGPWSVK